MPDQSVRASRLLPFSGRSIGPQRDKEAIHFGRLGRSFGPEQAYLADFQHEEGD